jgi:apolipoprotein N-acyltransferase
MKKIFFCILSAVLLALSFPKVSLSLLAFVSLVPLFMAMKGERPRRSFALSYLCGVVFFFMTFSWLLFVTKLGTVFLLAFLALYFGFFGIGYCWLSKKKLLAKIFLIPALWVAIEYIRAHFLTGFGWALLGHSQYQNLWLIQIADITGVYGISFLIVMVNVVIADALLAKPKALLYERLFSFIIIVFLFGVSIGYSFFVLKNNFGGQKIRVGVAQGNISLRQHWDPKAWPFILRDYFALSEQLIKEKSDLIIWPESSYPGSPEEEPGTFEQFKDSVARTKIPHVIGIVIKEDENYFNSALLFSSNNKKGQRYDKLHLVPFGEYIPLRDRLPFLASIVPIDDFIAGKEVVLFEAPQNQKDKKTQQGFFYSVLVCFEDTIPELARACVRKGSNLLVNISNDAWFGDTNEPFLHLQSAVFRSIENHRYLVRCGNIGISCFIDPCGRILKRVEANGKSTYIQGAVAEDVYFINKKTLYTKVGEIFAYFCISGILITIILDFVRRRKIF